MLCQPCNCLFYHLHDVLSIGGDYRLFLQFTMEINMPGFGEGILPSAPSQTALPLLADFLLHAFHFYIEFDVTDMPSVSEQLRPY